MKTVSKKSKPNIQMAYVAGGIFLSALVCSYVGITRDYMTAIEHITGPTLALLSGLICLAYLFFPRRFDKHISNIFILTTGVFLLVAQLEAAFITVNNIAFYQIWIPAYYLMLTFADRRKTRFRWTFIYFSISAITVGVGMTFGVESVFDRNGLLLINALIGQLVVVAVFSILGKTLRKAGAHEAEAKTLALSSERLKIAADMAHMARREAERASAAKSAFVANMSHELRTPLNAIIGFSDILSNPKMKPIANERFAEYGNDINKSGRHLLSIVNDILDVAKIEAGRMEIFEEDTDFLEIVQTAITLAASEEAIGNRQIDLNDIDKSHVIYADMRLITQVVTNLLSNAVKFTNDDGIIAFKSTRSARGEALLTISDNGIGIEPDKLDTIMQPFVQSEGVYAKSNSGTGLGLHLVNMMMELHGGTCSLSSTLGHGTTVLLTFPPERALHQAEDVAAQ